MIFDVVIEIRVDEKGYFDYLNTHKANDIDDKILNRFIEYTFPRKLEYKNNKPTRKCSTTD